MRVAFLWFTFLAHRFGTRGAPKLISERRLCDAVDIMLSLQNTDGGFASYELIRAPQWMEYLNPAEVFGELVYHLCTGGYFDPGSLGNIMTEFNYPECTTSVITALSIFRKYYPKYRARDIQ